MKTHARLLTGAALFALAAPAAGQVASGTDQAGSTDVQANEEVQSTEEDDEIVVTAVARGSNRLDTSVSASSISADDIANSSPRSAAEIFRNIPGIRAESSGGEGNANIAVRGLPVASGGAKFLQLQEDGLPILEFGDITFGNADIFLRSDFNVARVEAVRGGSASTFASNSPGGVINLISKTGEVEGGAVQGTVGVDYGEYRLDFDYASKISDTLRFHVGGFYRQGSGPRDPGYDGNKGGQIKANITKDFDAGYIRFTGKYLDDRAIGYLPNPVRVTGTNDDPNYSNVPGFDINEDTLHSRYLIRNLTLDGNNERTERDVRDGQRALVKAVGLETQFDIGGGFTVTERFRYADTSGSFTSPFPGSVDSAAATAASIGGPGATLSFANGPNAGQVIANPGGLNGNGLLASIVLFDVELNSLDNITNDIRISREVDLGSGSALFTAGFYASSQTIDTDWLWTSFLLEVKGGGEAALVDVRNAAGVFQTENGVYGYGARFFGNCCRRSYDVEYTTKAPFASVSFDAGKLNLDGSVRFDFGKAKGEVAGSDLGGGRVGVTTLDINNDGRISAPETQVSVIPLNQPAPVDYSYDYISYSLGANYRLTDALAGFARYSRGARANADRLLFGPAVRTTDGRLVDKSAAIDFVQQAEAGVKYRASGLSLFATGFYAKTEEQNFEATTQTFFDRKYRAYGVELEAAYRTGPFQVSAGGTYTDAEITRDAINPGTVGNTPRRQADFVYQVTPQYEDERFTVGANIIGTTESFAQDNNQLKLPGFTQVNAFVVVRPVDRISLSVNANNLFNTEGFTEAEEGSIPANGIVRARAINGRTVSASVKFEF